MAEGILARAKSRDLGVQELSFDYHGHEGKITILKPLLGRRGWLSLTRFAVEALDQAEDYLLFAAITDQGEVLDEEVARRLFSLPASLEACSVFPEFRREIECRLQSHAEQRQTEIRRAISDRNARFFEAEAEKLDSWADDQKLSLEREIKEMDRQIKEARRSATASVSLEEKLAGQKEIKALEAQRNQMRRSLFDAQDRIDLQREKLIAQIESKLTQQTRIEKLFLIRWCLQ